MTMGRPPGCQHQWQEVLELKPRLPAFHSSHCVHLSVVHMKSRMKHSRHQAVPLASRKWECSPSLALLRVALPRRRLVYPLLAEGHGLSWGSTSWAPLASQHPLQPLM